VDLLYKGLITGLILLTGSALAFYRVWYYYKRLSGPWKDLAGRTLMSLLFLMFGSAGVVVDSLTKRKLWGIMAFSYTLSYLVIFSTVFAALRVIEKEKTFNARRSTPPKVGRITLPMTGGYIVRRELSPLALIVLKKVSGGLMVISRTPQSEWVERFKIEPDEFIWLSRAEEVNSVDPSKLHVIQGKILKFIEEKGAVSVYFEGIEYLTLYNDFSSVAKFLFALKDAVIIHGSLLIISFPRGIFGKRQEALILREFKEISEEALLKEFSRYLSSEEAQEVLLFGALPPKTKRLEGKYAGGKSPEGESGADKKEAQEARPLRREEKTEEGR
jgi:hypothetical protein